MNKQSNIQYITLVGIFAALVFLFSRISIDIPLGPDTTRLHLGNVFCILSGIVLGGAGGGLAAGIGSFLFDITNPLYISDAPFTFMFKFAMAFICGRIVWSGGRQGLNSFWNTVGAAIGSAVYVVLYLGKGFLSDTFFLNLEFQTALITAAQKGLVSITNAVIAVIISVPLAISIKKALGMTQMYRKLQIK